MADSLYLTDAERDTQLTASREQLAQSQEAFKHQARRLKAITDATPTMIAHVNSELCHEYCNCSYANRFGGNPDEMVGTSVADVIGLSNYEKFHDHLQRALDGQRIVAEIELELPPYDRTSNQSTVFKEVTFVPDHEDDGSTSGCFIFAIEITERRRSAMEIAKREERLAAVTERMTLTMESAGMGSFEWNPKTDEVVWDEQHLAITGLTVEDHTTGRMFVDLIHPDDRPRNRMLIERAIATRGDYEGEFRITRPDGQVRWLAGRARMVPNKDGSGDRLIGLNWDITEQKSSLAQVRRAEERLRLAAEAAGFGTYEIDLVHRRTHWSAEFKKLVGATPEADRRARAGVAGDFVHPDDRKEVLRHLTNARRGLDGGVHSFMHRIVLPDGQQRWVRRQGQTVFDEVTGKPIQVIGTLLDITSQKETEDSLEEARRVAEAANESKSEFLANMSHEIRTPMSAIMGYTEILSRQLSDPDNLKCTSIIRHNGKFLLEIINDILDISKIEAGKLELTKKRFQPERLVSDVRSLMDVRAVEKGISLDVSFQGLIPKTIRSDAKRLKQILVNLLGNAIKFTKVGSVRLVVSTIDMDQQPLMQFEIIDTGIGINKKQLTTLFQPFTQADSSVLRQFEGTGLGLSISQRLAQMLGGKITVESIYDVGSKFTLTIAAGSLKSVQMVEPQLSPAQSKSPVRAAVQSKLAGRILVVDDRRDMRFLAQHMIEDAGGEVETAENGLAAIAKIEHAVQTGQSFDLVTMDMQMPVLDGYEATRRLRESGYVLPIIAVTAHAMEGDRERCMEAGCTEYITKPLDAARFIELLADHIRYRSGKNVHPAPDACKILVVDDAKDACESLQTLLGFSGYCVDVAHDGESSLSKAAAINPDVVLLDIGLPDMTGFEVLDRMKQLESMHKTTYIAATGEMDSVRMKAAGFDHHLVKPFDINKLERLIQAVTARDINH